jgi:hypothetical protein
VNQRSPERPAATTPALLATLAWVCNGSLYESVVNCPFDLVQDGRIRRRDSYWKIVG